MGAEIQNAPDVGPPRHDGRPAVDADALDSLTHAWGRRLFSGIHQAERLTPGRFIHRRLLRLLGEDDSLRFALLRFVDVYPALNSDAEIAAHLREYVSALPASTSRDGFAGSFVRRLMSARLAPDAWVAAACRAMIERIGSGLIAGENPDEVAPRLRSLERQGLLFSLDLLGEHVSSREQADRFATRYRTMIETLPERLGAAESSEASRKAGPRVNLSIKLSALTHLFDPLDPRGTTRRVIDHLRPLFIAARQHDVFLNLDMERYAFRDLTLEIVKELLSDPDMRGYPHVGVVMQAYLRDAEPNLKSWLDWLDRANQPMTIRLVKGAYWDSEQIWAAQKGWPIPVHVDKSESDRQFERMTRTLLEHRHLVRTAVASHNVRSVAHALALKELMEVPDERFECQLLYGMAEELAEALVEANQTVRIYTPCGELVEGMSYLVRRILENTANTSFLLHAALRDMDEEALLRKPGEEAAP